MDTQEIVGPTDKKNLVKILIIIIPLQVIFLIFSSAIGIKYSIAVIIAVFMLSIPVLNLELGLSILLFLFIFMNRPLTAVFTYRNILIQDVFFLLIVITWLLRRLISVQPEEFRGSSLTKSYFFFLIIGCFAAFIGFNNHNKLFEILYEMREIFYLLTFFIIIDIIQNVKQIYLILTSFIISTLMFAIESIIGSVTKSRLITFGVTGFRYVEPTSAFLALGVILCVSLLLLGKTTRTIRILLFGSMSIIGTALLLSLTRGYWLGCATGLLFVFFFLPLRRKFIVILIALVMLCIAVAVSAMFLGFSPQFIINIFTSRAISLKFFSFDPSAMARIVEIESILKELPKSLIFGKGLGAALYIYKYDRNMWMEWTYFHNNYFEMLLKMGILGLFAYFTLVINFFKAGFKSLKQSSTTKKAIIVGILGMYVCMIVTSLTSGVVLFLDTAPLIGILMGIIVVIQNFHTDNSNSDVTA